MKQQRSASLAKWKITKLVEYDQIHAHQSHRNASGTPILLLSLQQIDQINRGVEPCLVAMRRNTGHRNGGSQMCLAGSRSSDEHHVLRCLGKRQRRQLLHQMLIDLRGTEVESGQITMHWELGGIQLVSY